MDKNSSKHARCWRARQTRLTSSGSPSGALPAAAAAGAASPPPPPPPPEPPSGKLQTSLAMSWPCMALTKSPGQKEATCTPEACAPTHQHPAYSLACHHCHRNSISPPMHTSFVVLSSSSGKSLKRSTCEQVQSQLSCIHPRSLSLPTKTPSTEAYQPFCPILSVRSMSRSRRFRASGEPAVRSSCARFPPPWPPPYEAGRGFSPELAGVSRSTDSIRLTVTSFWMLADVMGRFSSWRMRVA